MDLDYVETEATNSPRFGEAEPHPSSPTWRDAVGAFARRIGPAAIRSMILGGLAVAVVFLVAEIL